MTKAEALQALANGKTLTHVSFSQGEFVYENKEGYYVFEDGVVCPPSEFWAYRTQDWWETDWELFNN